MSCRPVMPTLQVLEAGEAGRIYELLERSTLIGRVSECHICLPDHMVSKRHARIVRGAAGCMIEDLESRNHTYVDNSRLAPNRPVLLKNGAVVRICDYLFLFRDQLIQVVEEDQAQSSTILGMRDLTPSEENAPGADPDVALRAVVEFQRAIGGSLELDAILPRAIETLFSIFPQAECGFLVLKEKDALVPKAAHCRYEPAEALTISRTILDHVLQEKKAILSTDAGLDPLFQESDSIHVSMLRTVMCAPILDRHGEAVGIVQIDTRSAKASFGTRELDLLSGLASMIGVAIELVRLHEIESRHQRAEREQKFAREVQMALLPPVRPALPGYRFWDFYEPALNVGGDYYDYIHVDRPDDEANDAVWAVAVGDVAGKGLAAALMMAKLGSDVLMSVLAERDPVRMMERLNRRLCDARLPERYVTLILAIVDGRNHRVSLVNAGHTSPIVRRADGSVETLPTARSGMMLGIDQGESYQATEVTLQPGDAILLFTDGIQEAMNPAGKLLGLPQLIETVRSAPQRADQIGNHVLKAVRHHAAGTRQSDDIALVCFGRLDA